MRFKSKVIGLTLTELLIGMLVLTLAWLSAIGVIIVSKYSLSYSKHKTQAMYVAQRIFEEGRRWSPFYGPSGLIDTSATSTNGFAVSHTGMVYKDMSSTFVYDPSDDFTGNPEVNSEVKVISLDDYGGAIGKYRARVTVKINWNQRFGGTRQTKTEYFTTDITSEDVLR